MTTQIRNEVLLEGVALETPSLSHENHSTRFYRFPLQVPRLSGQVDTLPILLPESMLPQVTEGGNLRVQGQLRSFNNRSGVGSRLVLTVYARSISPGLDEPCNQITLSGTLCKPPVFRRTPLGRSICDLMLAAPRRYGLGPAGGAGGASPGGRPPVPGGKSPKPYIPQGHGSWHRGAGSLRGVYDALAGIGAGGEMKSSSAGRDPALSVYLVGKPKVFRISKRKRRKPLGYGMKLPLSTMASTSSSVT